MIAIDLAGLGQTLARLAALEVAAKAAQRPVAAAVGVPVLSAAKARVPVDTGRLKASLVEQPDPEDSSAVVVGSVGLSDLRAVATEFGTYKDPAQPWLRPAAGAASTQGLALAVPALLRALGVGL